MDDRKLHDLFRQASSQSWEWAPECPEAHEIAAYVDGATHESARDEFELHLADCERCTLLVGTLSRLEIEATDGASVETLERARRLVPQKSTLWTQYLPHLAAAAVLVLAVSVSFSVRQNPPVPSESDYRTTRGPTPQLDMQIVSPAAGAGVGADDLVIRWTEIPGARYYVVRIVTGSGKLVTEQRVTDTYWRPASAVPLEAGQEYYVRVEAYPSVGPSTGSVHVPFMVRGSR